jgi:hypothetical protein
MDAIYKYYELVGIRPRSEILAPLWSFVATPQRRQILTEEQERLYFKKDPKHGLAVRNNIIVGGKATLPKGGRNDAGSVIIY